MGSKMLNKNSFELKKMDTIHILTELKWLCLQRKRVLFILILGTIALVKFGRNTEVLAMPYRADQDFFYGPKRTENYRSLLSRVDAYERYVQHKSHFANASLKLNELNKVLVKNVNTVYNKIPPSDRIKTEMDPNSHSAQESAYGISDERMYTIQELRTLASVDMNFLAEIVTQKYYNPDSRSVLLRYFLGFGHTFEADFRPELEVGLQTGYTVQTDVLVFLHIQKTGGRYLNDRVFEDLEKPCYAKPLTPCQCHYGGKLWLYMDTVKYCNKLRCGLHADWTHMHKCIPRYLDELEGGHRERRYFYMTQLRDPLDRYISEWHHQKSGGQWEDAVLGCARDNHVPWESVRPCFNSKNWINVTLDEFTECKYNLATNRQTRMLADLRESGCYEGLHDEEMKKERAIKWVRSAKENLQKMEYFGLMGKEESSDRLFQHAFGLKFKRKGFDQGSGSEKSRITKRQFLRILQLIELDIQTFLFAEDLFKYRLKLISK